MNTVDNEVPGEGDDKSVTAVSTATKQQAGNEPLECYKENEDNKQNQETQPKEEETMSNTVRLLGDPLVTHGPYTFYGGLAYRKRGDMTKRKRRRWKKQQSRVTLDDGKNISAAESCDSASSCCCVSDGDCNDLCSCDDGSSSRSSSSSRSEWSVVRMNHFYAVRPWYSKKNSCTDDLQQIRQRRRRRRREHSPKLTSSTTEEWHHYQQSVCIGELELLWRDDSLVTTTVPDPSSTPKKRIGNRVKLSPTTAASNGGSDRTDAITSCNYSHMGAGTGLDEDYEDDDYEDVRKADGSAADLPRRRMLPRRTRQPSIKHIEATESYAAGVVASSNHSMQSLYSRNRLSTTASSDLTPRGDLLSSSNVQYRHGNVLCSVRLYVMPDQTAAGRLSGVHGEDEVLEINTLGANGGVDRWPSNILSINGGGGIGSLYNGGSVDDYGYGSGSHSSRTRPTGSSGLVLRAEDFVEWVRGGLMNDDDDDMESFGSSESECDEGSFHDPKPIKTNEPPPKQKEEQLELSSLAMDIESEVKKEQVEKLEICHNDENVKVKLESTVEANVVKKEELIPVNTDKLKKEQEVAVDLKDDKKTKDKFGNEDNHNSKSAVDEAVEAERIPLAAAKIKQKHDNHSINRHYNHCYRQHRCLKTLVNGCEGENTSAINTKRNRDNCEITSTVNKADSKLKNDQKCYCYCCKRHRLNYQCNNKKIITLGDGSNNTQRLVVMSYSRYCRYRAQLQRRFEEQLNVGDTTIVAKGGGEKTTTHRVIDSMNKTRVLFCRDTYDYPAELLLEPFKAQQSHQQNTSVLVNHMAPKLKGWPAHPASWMSFRWNRVRRRLRHLEHGSGSNNDQRRRRRQRRKLKKKCGRQNGATMAISYLSSTEDDDSDDSDSDDGSSATNDAATNTTTTASTSDSDGAPPSSSVVVKTANKNRCVVTSKVNIAHYNSKKTFSTAGISNLITINGAASSIAAAAVNKRLAANIGQPIHQQPIKRRRIVNTTESQSKLNTSSVVVSATGGQQQQLFYHQKQQQQQYSKPRQLQQPQFNNRSRQFNQFNQFNQVQRNQPILVFQKQQQKPQSFNRRLPTNLSSISPTTRIIHHHLPPSVTIMPVIVPTTNSNAQQQQQKQQQQQQRFNNRPPNRPKQHTVAGSSATSQRRNNDSNLQPMSLPPVIIEYDDDDDNQEYGSDNNGRYKKTSTVAAAMAACHRHVERQAFEYEQRQQREEEERQRRWLVDALRLGGLEVTVVPLNVGSGSGNSRGSGRDIDAAVTVTALTTATATVTATATATATATSQQPRHRQWRQSGVPFEPQSSDKEFYNSNIAIRNEQRHGGGDDNSSNLDTSSDSVVMTITPDVVCILNKSQEEQVQKSHQQQAQKSHQQQGQRVHQQKRSPSSGSTLTASTSILDILCGDRNRQQHQQRNNSGMSAATSSTSLQQQVVIMDASSAASTSIQQQQNKNKRKPQPNRKY